METSNLLEATDIYFQNNMDLIPLEGKKPLDNNWTDGSIVKYTKKGIERCIDRGDNVGYRVKEGMLIIDVDPRNGGLTSWDKLQKNFPQFQWGPMTVETPNGGWHIYLNLPLEEDGSYPKVPTKSLEYPGIDFLSSGKQVVIPGSLGANGKYYTFSPSAIISGWACPGKLIETLQKEGATRGIQIEHQTPADREEFHRKHGWGVIDAPELQGLLLALAPENYREYSSFFSLIASCHFSTAGSTEALNVFIAWAIQDYLYTDAAGNLEKHWNSLTQDGSRVGGVAITALTLIHELKKVGCTHQIQFITTRIGNLLREGISFEPVIPVDTANSTDVNAGIESAQVGIGITPSGDSNTSAKQSTTQITRSWLNKLRSMMDTTEITGQFMTDLSEAAGLLPSQIETILLEIKEKTGIGIVSLREDMRVRSNGVADFLSNINDNRDTVTQVRIVNAVINTFGNKENFIHNQNTFWKWGGDGKWSAVMSPTIAKEIMDRMGTESFPSITAGAISSVLRMIEVVVHRDPSVWDGGESGMSLVELSRAKYSIQDAPVINMLDGEFHLAIDGQTEFDEMLGLERTASWTTKNHQPSSFKRTVLPVRTNPYNKGYENIARPVEWHKFLDRALWCEDVAESTLRKRQLAVFIVYSMVESMPWLKKAIYLYGPPDSGKSVVMDIVGELMGGNANSAYLSITHMGDRFAPSQLNGKLVNFAGEIGVGELIADAAFKMLISGDTMMVEAKGQDGFAMQNKSVFWFAGNNLPRSKDKSSGVESRMCYIPFEWSVPQEERDYSLRAKLSDELDGIGKWAMDIFAEEWVKDKCNGIVNKLSVGQLKIMNDWKDESDPSRIWFGECLVVSMDSVHLSVEDGDGFSRSQKAGNFITMQGLYNSYKYWCRETGHRMLTRNHLGRTVMRCVTDIAAALPPVDRQMFLGSVTRGVVNNTRGWYGLHLVNT